MGAKFCINCGAATGSWSKQPTSTLLKSRTRVASLLPLLVIALVVFFTGIGGLIYWQLGQERTKDAGPKISDIKVTHVGETSATIEWKTDVPSSSQVEYGRTNKYGFMAPLEPKNDPSKQSTGVTSHSVLISQLAQGTTYHFRVRSKDAQGNEAVSTVDMIFKTLRPDKERYNPDLD